MAQPAVKHAPEAFAPEPAAAPSAPHSRPERVGADAVADDVGPALALQAYLRDALEEEAQVQDRWSPRKTLGFVAISSGLLWAVILGGLTILS